MDRRLAALPFLAAAAAVYACGGPLPHLGGEPLATVGTARAEGKGAARGPIATRAHRQRGDTLVDAALTVRTADGVAFTLAVENPAAHRVELTFPDGRTRDFAVYDAGGHEVWRWSRGRLFTQTMQNKMLAAGDSVVYAEQWTSPAPGRYTVVAELLSDNYPIVRRATFVVPAPAAPTQVAAH